MKRKKIKPRNPYAGPAKSRSGAGPMRDRRAPRGGSRNEMLEDLEEWEQEREEEHEEKREEKKGRGEGKSSQENPSPRNRKGNKSMPKITIQTCRSNDREAARLRERNQALDDQIRERAYFLSLQRGAAGSPLDDWLRAEREVVHRPLCSLSEQEERYFLCFALPGMRGKQVRLTALPNEIVIQGEEAPIVSEKNSRLHFSELCEREVFRRVGLPGNIDIKGIGASLNRGVLEVKIPKKRARGTSQKAGKKKTQAKAAASR